MKRRLAYSALIILLFFGLYWMNFKMIKRYAPKWQDWPRTSRDSPVLATKATRLKFPADINKMPLDSNWLDQHSEIKIDTTR